MVSGGTGYGKRSPVAAEVRTAPAVSTIKNMILYIILFITVTRLRMPLSGKISKKLPRGKIGSLKIVEMAALLALTNLDARKLKENFSVSL